MERLRKRVAQARALVREIGMSQERIRLLEGIAGDEEATVKAIVEMRAAVAGLGFSGFSAGRQSAALAEGRGRTQ